MRLLHRGQPAEAEADGTALRPLPQHCPLQQTVPEIEHPAVPGRGALAEIERLAVHGDVHPGPIGDGSQER